MKPKSQVLTLFALVMIMLGLLLWGLGNALLPLFAAFFMTYLLYPLIIKLERKGIKREIAISGVFTGATLVLVISLVLVIPALIKDGRAFLKELPGNVHSVVQKLESIAHDNGYELEITKEDLRDAIESNISMLSGGTVKALSRVLQKAFQNIVNVILFILNIFLIPLFFFYVANDYEKITDTLKSFIPKTIRPILESYMKNCNTVMSGYIRGQMMVACLLGILYACGLSLVGLKFGFLIGLMAGALSIIPYVGFTIGFMSAIIVALANHASAGSYLGIIIVFMMVQTMEGFFITPKLVGDKVGLSALGTMLALIIGGNVFGLLGMLVAIPTAAILKTILLDLRLEIQDLESADSPTSILKET